MKSNLASCAVSVLLALLGHVVTTSAASGRALALNFGAFGCITLVDLDLSESLVAPPCLFFLLDSETGAMFPDVLAAWAEADGIGLVIKDRGHVAVARIPTFADDVFADMAFSFLDFDVGPLLVFPSTLEGPEVLDATSLPDGRVLLWVQDRPTETYWTCELDRSSGDVTALFSIAPLYSINRGGIAYLGGDEVLVSIVESSGSLRFYAMNIVSGAMTPLGGEYLDVPFTGASAALTDAPQGGFLHSNGRWYFRVVLEPGPFGRPRARLEESVGIRDLRYTDVSVGGILAFLPPGGEPSGCVPDGGTLCLQGFRYRATVTWKTPTGVGHGVARQTSDDSGSFWFFNADNVEMLVKVLDACTVDGHVWVFASAATNVEYTLRVEDTATATVREYFHAFGAPATATTDTSAFASCDTPAGLKRGIDEAFLRTRYERMRLEQTRGAGGRGLRY